MANTPFQVQRSRLKQVPIDVWSIREKLCLASFVLKSGDQNWSSVSRPLKAFGEPNRPADWFSQKNCALQYSDLLEKIEMPKRKRGERGEETAEDLIVKKLNKERIEELKNCMKNEKEKCRKLRKELEMLKSGNVEEEKLKEIWNRKKEEEHQKELDEVDHKKWLQERDTKIAAMKATRGFVMHGIVNKQKSPVSPASSPTKSGVKLEPESAVDSPLSVDIEDSSASAGQQNVETKLTPPHAGASTSPLLTSLLQSPTPSTSSMITSSMNPLLLANQMKQDDLSKTPSTSTQQFFPPTSLISSPSRQISISTAQTPTGVTLVVSGGSDGSLPKNASGVLIAPSSSPTLSKLLEMPPSVPGKLPPLPIIEAQAQKQAEQSKVSTISFTKLTPNIPVKNDNEIIEVETKDNISHDVEIENAKDKRSEDDAVDSNVENSQIEFKSEDKKSESEKKESDQSVRLEIVELQQEAVKVQGVSIKQELPESLNITPLNSSTPFASRKRRRHISPVDTPQQATRRSGRVKALSDKKAAQEEPETSDPTSAAQKKRGSVDESVTETSMSEESLDAAKINLPITPSESVPNSPASSTMHSEDTENNKEYKTWKKSIMLAYKTAATHKFASLFMHPVTDDEAAGYSEVVYKRMDLVSIKKKIENGQIRSTAEFQRDIMLMFQNAIMYNTSDHDVHQMAIEMQKEIVESIEDFIETQQQSNQSSEAKLRTRERRGAMNTPSTSLYEDRESGRRKSRGASTDTDTRDPGSANQIKSVKKKVQLVKT